MKRILALAVGLSALAPVTGCVNVYTRCPGTSARIESTYQSTETAFSTAIVCAFPQAMSDNPGDYRFKALNLLTVPLGVVVLADALCEAGIDTVCSPVDYLLAKRRECRSSDVQSLPNQQDETRLEAPHTGGRDGVPDYALDVTMR